MRPVSAASSYEAEFNTETLPFLSTYTRLQLIFSVSGYTINPATGALTAIVGSPFAAGDSPYFVAVDSSGKFAYVANTDGSNVSGYTINPVTGALTAIAGSPFLTGAAPVSVAITRAKPSVRAVYVTNEGSKSVSVINPTTNTVVATVTVGPIPVDAVVTPNGASAYITDAGPTRSPSSTPPPTA
jgi:YVTN family beta-propeller protein